MLMSYKSDNSAVKRRQIKGYQAYNKGPISHEVSKGNRKWIMVRLFVLWNQLHRSRLIRSTMCFAFVSFFLFVASGKVSLFAYKKTPSSGNHPLVLGYYFSTEENMVIHVKRLPLYDYYRYPSKRQVEFSQEEFHRRIRNSKKYDRVRTETMVDPDCVLKDWQKLSFQTCNLMHENDIVAFLTYDHTSSPLGSKLQVQSQLIDSGYWRDGEFFPSTRHVMATF